MGFKRVACGILVSMTAATVGGFGVTAEAATQTQNQSQDLFTSQNQDIQTNGGITTTQNASSNMSTSQTETTSTGVTGSVPNDSNKTTVESDQSQTVKGEEYSSNETQHNSVTSSQGRTGDSNSAQFQSDVQATSSQNGSLTTTGKAEMTQGQATLIENQQIQTRQYESATTPQGTTHGSAVPSLDWSNLPTKSSFAWTDVIGYAFFDQNGNRLSSAYGMYPNPDNNETKHYSSFAPFQPTTVVVKAVNAYGEPVNNPTPQPIVLRSNNGNGMFLMANSTQIVYSVLLPAGSDGLQITYMNNGENPQYDILDASRLSFYIPPQRKHDPIMIIDQTEQGTVSGTTATQSEKGILTTVQNNASDSTQAQQTSANADANETQSVTSTSGDKLNQTQNLTVTGNQDATNYQDSANTWTATASQNATSTTTNPVQLNQHQAVAVADYWQHINVTVQQSHGTDGSGNLWLNQLLNVTIPTSDPQVGSRTINVTVGSHNYQYEVGAGGPVVFDESQSVDTSKDNTVAGTFDITYGSTVYHVPMSE